MSENFWRYREFRIDRSPALDTFARWLVDGIAAAAEQNDVYMQLCMAQPSDMLLALHAPRVTQLRVSNDFSSCAGSWDIGASSLLAWALGFHPSCSSCRQRVPIRHVMGLTRPSVDLSLRLRWLTSRSRSGAGWPSKPSPSVAASSSTRRPS